MTDRKEEIALNTEDRDNRPIIRTAKSGGLNVFSDAGNFEVALRMADCLANSTVVPKDYQGNTGNCMIAIEMASRINTSPMMVMQNLYIVNGRPAWSSQWIIAMINSSHRYNTELQFDFGHAKEDGGLSCQAWAEDYRGHKVVGPKITMNMANSEGWTTKNNSKWKTMPEVMIQYRAASFFGRMNCPDMIMGIYSQDEIVDMVDVSDVSEGLLTCNGDGKDDEPESSDHALISQEQRQKLFKCCRNTFGTEGNSILKGILEKLGIESTAKITTSMLKIITEEVERIANDRGVAQDSREE